MCPILFLLNGPKGKLGRPVAAPSVRFNAVPRFAVPAPYPEYVARFAARPSRVKTKTKRKAARRSARGRSYIKSSPARRRVAASRHPRKERQKMSFIITTRRRRRNAPKKKKAAKRKVAAKRKAPRRRKASGRVYRKGTFKKGWSAKRKRGRKTWFRKPKSNPPGRRRARRAKVRGRRRARRNLPNKYTFARAGSGSWLRNRPKRRRRKAGRKHFGKRRRARRNPPFVKKGIVASIIKKFKDVATKETAVQVVGGAAGLSVSLWGPKLLGFYVKPQLGRGWGGVASSVASVAVVSGIVRMFNPRLGRAVFVGGLIGSLAGALSAISCKVRTVALPIETGLLACALPTNPAGSSVQQQLAAAGVPAGAAAQIAQAAGLRGFGEYLGATPVGSIVAGEASFRNALGMGDYPQIAGASGVPIDSVVSSNETF